MGNKQKVYIAIPVFNRLKHTIACIEALEKSNYTNRVIVVCDDGSTDGTSEYLSNNHLQVIVLHGNGDLWWTGGINKCVKYILGQANSDDLIVTLNNDVTVGPEYLNEMVKAHREHPQALIGSLVLFQDDPTRIETAEAIHCWATAKKGYANQFGERVTAKHHGAKAVPKLCGKGVLIPVKVFKKIGLYDQKSFLQYAADEDFSIRAAKAGYELLINFDGRVYSDYSATGLGTRHSTPKLKEFLKSLFSKKSPNNLIIKWRFTFRHCPVYLIPQHLVLDVVRTVGGFFKRYAEYYLGRRQID